MNLQSVLDFARGLAVGDLSFDQIANRIEDYVLSAGGNRRFLERDVTAHGNETTAVERTAVVTPMGETVMVITVIIYDRPGPGGFPDRARFDQVDLVPQLRAALAA